MKKLNYLLTILVLTGFIAHAQYSAINVNSQNVTKGIGSLASDNDGNIIVTGAFLTSITIGSTTLTNSNPGSYTNGRKFSSMNASFITKMTAGGTYIWVKQIIANKPPTKKVCGTLNSKAEILGVSTDVSGNVYLTGYFYGSVSFGSITLLTIQRSGAGACSEYDRNIFTAKMDPNGNFLWAKQEGIVTEHTEDFGHSITSDAAGNVYTTGRMIQKEVKTVVCNPSCGTQGGSTLCPGYQLYIYVVKYNTNGTKIWEKKYANNTTTCNWTMEGSSIVSDGNYIYVSGRYIGTVNFGNSYTFTSTASNLFLLKLDGNGNTVWAKKVSNSLDQINNNYLILDNNGQDIYVSGSFSGTNTFDNIILTATNTNKFLGKYSSSTGICSWAVNAGYGFTPNAYPAKETFIHPNGNIGIIATDLGMPLTIKEFSTNGLFQTATIATNVNTTDRVQDIISLPDGFVYSQNLRGFYDLGSTTIASTQVPTSSFRDLMLVKYAYVPPSNLTKKDDDSAEKLNSVSLYVEISNNPFYEQFSLQIRSKDENPVQVRIFDLNGRVMHAAVINPYETEISLGGNLQAGIYYVEITRGNERRLEKIIKIE